jgi:uncharacterized protein (TIGR04222 family)
VSLELLRKIESFDIDGPGSPELPFADRLARENGWSRAFADRVIAEYRRFVYLAMTAGHPATPSEVVDRAWHLHLTYTRSYWDRFCREVLGQPLHHDPTRGGPAEAERHRRQYEQTLESYRRIFGEEPPDDVWPPADSRASQEVDQPEAVSPGIVPPLGRVVPTLAFVVGVIAFALWDGNPLNPFDWVGPEFLKLYASTAALALAAGVLYRSWLRGPQPVRDEELPDLDRVELAFLTGGRIRAMQTAVVHLCETGALKRDPSTGKLSAATLPATFDSRLEATVFRVANQNPGGVTWANLRWAVERAGPLGVGRVWRERLLTTPGANVASRLVPAFLLGAVALGLGLPKVLVGLERQRPVEFLIFGTALTAGLGLAMLVIGVRQTRRGRAVVREFSSRYRNSPVRSLFRPAVPTPNLAWGVALAGIGTLAGTAHAGLIATVAPFPSGSSGSGTDGGTSGGGGCGGGGGGGGGGCGGCGGG